MKLFILLLPLLAYGNFAPQSEVESCITKSANKLIVPADASITVFKTCVTGPCVEIPPNFSCITFSYLPKSMVTECTIIPPEPPENTSPTEPLPPVVPQCDSIQCPMGQTRTATDTAVTCSWQALEEDPTKKAAYDDQKESAEQAQSQYQESQLYYNLQNFCLYSYQTTCASLPPATQSSSANSLSSTLGKTPEQIKTLMNKKVNK